jgi:hypothetical protein
MGRPLQRGPKKEPNSVKLIYVEREPKKYVEAQYFPF